MFLPGRPLNVILCYLVRRSTLDIRVRIIARRSHNFGDKSRFDLLEDLKGLQQIFEKTEFYFLPLTHPKKNNPGFLFKTQWKKTFDPIDY